VGAAGAWASLNTMAFWSMMKSFGIKKGRKSPFLKKRSKKLLLVWFGYWNTSICEAPD